MLQHVTVCTYEVKRLHERIALRSVLQCVAACCSMLQRIAVCCSVLQRVALCTCEVKRLHKRLPLRVGKHIKTTREQEFVVHIRHPAAVAHVAA